MNGKHTGVVLMAHGLLISEDTMSLIEIVAYDLYLAYYQTVFERFPDQRKEWDALSATDKHCFLNQAQYVIEHYVSKDTVKSAIDILIS